MHRSTRSPVLSTVALWGLVAGLATSPAGAEVGVDECPVLVAAPRTSFSLSDGYFVGSVATFAADPGNELVGASTLTCQVDLTWSGTPPMAQKTNAVVIVPNTGLSGGDSVEIQLTGFAPLADLAWAQCILPLDVNPEGNCTDFDPAGRGQADAAGSLTATRRLQRFIYVPNAARWVDCTDPAESCVIGAADISDIANGNWAPLGFTPAPAPPTERGTISLTPAGPVAGPGSVISVTGAGFRSDEVVDLYQCVADPVHPSACNRPAASAVTDGSGAFTADITVGATVTASGGSTTDCFGASGACVIAAAEAVDFPATVVAADLVVTPRVLPGPTAIRLEGDTGTRMLNVVVGLSEPSAQTVTVDWVTFFSPAWSFAVAVPGVDYVAAGGTVTFAPGQIAQTVSITINGDVTFEPNELVVVKLSNPVNAKLNGGLLGAVGWGNIANDD